MNFEEYWGAYASADEAISPDKNQWSRESLDKGILKAALSVVRACAGLASEPTYWQRESVLHCAGSFGVIRLSITTDDCADGELSLETVSYLAEVLPTSLVICIVPTTNVQAVLDSMHEDWLPGVILLFPTDIDALAQGSCKLKELIEYKLYRRYYLDRPENETAFRSSTYEEFRAQRASRGRNFRKIAEVVDDLGDDLRDWIEHPKATGVLDVIRRGQNCVLEGPSSSGKTVLAVQVGQRAARQGFDTLYANLSVVSGCVFDILDVVLFGDEDTKSVLIVDDAQSNPAAARFTASVLRTGYHRCTSRASVVFASWPDFARSIYSIVPNGIVLPVQPQQVRVWMVNDFRKSMDRELVDDVASQFGEDLLLLRMALTRAKSTGAKPKLGDMAASVWGTRSTRGRIRESDKSKIGLVVASLGSYDLPAPVPFVTSEAEARATAVEALTSSGMLRVAKPGHVSLGHRSLCSLLVEWLSAEGTWSLFERRDAPRSPADVLHDYLRSEGAANALDALRALQARVGFKSHAELTRRNAAGVEIWRAFNALVERIEIQQSRDPTWGRSPASAMFAVQTLREVGKVSAASASIAFMRSHYSVERGKLTVRTDGLATESDFREIGTRMFEEDVIRGGQGGARTPAGEVNIPRFHRQWLSGVLLSAEAAYASTAADVRELADLVEAEQMASGAFYPERVPWVTARVLMGLAAAGRTIETSASVRRATEWLLRDESEGGCSRHGTWESGTGTWNTELETTAMVLMALAAVGVDCSQARFDVARTLLLDGRASWTKPGSELDGASAIQAYVESGGAWEDVADEAQALSRWAKGDLLWENVARSAEESHRQSCEVAQVASHLVNIGWTALRTDLPSFVEALAMRSEFRSALTQEEITAPRSPEMKAARNLDPSDPVSSAAQFLSGVSELRLGQLTVVGRYRRFDERVRNELRIWVSRMRQPLEHRTHARENFLIWAAPGSGKSFLIEQLAKELTNVKFVEINVAKQTLEAIAGQLASIESSDQPVLCMLDEIDAKPDESALYPGIFGRLDLNQSHPYGVVFVLVGSSGSGLEQMVGGMLNRNKGKDLIDRVPSEHRFAIAPAAIGDKLAMFAESLDREARATDHVVQAIEKTALLYVLSSTEFETPRQLQELALRILARLDPAERQVLYTDLFPRGSAIPQQFWRRHGDTMENLRNLFVRIEARD